MTDQIRIKVITDTGFSGAQHIDYLEFSRAAWEAMPESDRMAEIHEAGMNNISITGSVVDENDQPTGEQL